MNGISGHGRRKNPVYQAVKEVTCGWGNWKNCGRGDPKKGWKAGYGKVAQ